MTTYKGIKGLSIQTVAGDLSPVALGDIWYNNVARKIRGAKIVAGSWATGGTMNTGRQFVGHIGAYNAGLIAGGETTASVRIVEEYNGSTWSEVADLTDVKYNLRGFGDSTEACYMVGGRDPTTANMEAFDGSSWTETTNLPTATQGGACAGTSTAGVYAFGYAGGYINETYEWDGSSWTDGGDGNTARSRIGGTGIQTLALVFGGQSDPIGDSPVNTESYNGTSWTELNNLNTGRAGIGGSSFGRTNTSALAFGGELNPPLAPSVLTEKWDGTSLTEVGDLSVSNVYGAGLGTVNNAISAAGQGLIATAEEWSDPVYTIKTVTVS